MTWKKITRCRPFPWSTLFGFPHSPVRPFSGDLHSFGFIRKRASPSSIQQASNSDITSKTYTSFTAIFASPTTSGNAVVIGITYGNANPIITTTDTQGDIFLPAIQTWDSRHDQGSAILYAVNIVGGATKVTVQFSSPVAYLALAVHEYSGIAGLNVVAGQIGRASSHLRVARRRARRTTT